MKKFAIFLLAVCAVIYLSFRYFDGYVNLFSLLTISLLSCWILIVLVDTARKKWPLDIIVFVIGVIQLTHFIGALLSRYFGIWQNTLFDDWWWAIGISVIAIVGGGLSMNSKMKMYIARKKINSGNFNYKNPLKSRPDILARIKQIKKERQQPDKISSKRQNKLNKALVDACHLSRPNQAIAPSQTVEEILQLLENGANPNCKFDYETPLTALNYRKGAIKAAILVAAGAAMNAEAVHHAAKECYYITQVLIEAGADVNLCDSDGKNALMHHVKSRASRQSDFGPIYMLNWFEILLKHTRDINARDKKGRTILFYAAGRNHMDMVKRLIEKGADVSVKDNHGKTAADIASDDLQDGMADFLRRAVQDKRV